jgi:hypothetical protein
VLAFAEVAIFARDQATDAEHLHKGTLGSRLLHYGIVT